MKTKGIWLVATLLLILGYVMISAFNESPPSDEYRFGYRTTLSPTYDDTVDITLSNTLTVVDLTLTGDVVFNLSSSSKPVLGDRVIFVITATNASAAKDTVVFNTDFTAPTATIDTSKVKVFEFVYDGSDFKGVSTPLQLSILNGGYEYWFGDEIKRCDDIFQLSATNDQAVIIRNTVRIENDVFEFIPVSPG